MKKWWNGLDKLSFSKNRFWSWNKYSSELTLKVPLSLIAVFLAGVAVFALVATIVGSIINWF